MVANVADEVEAAEFGDARLTVRLRRVADAIASSPGEGFPQITADESELEAVYRFLRNEKVTAEKILAPHFAATWSRAGRQDVLVVHDTTGFLFGGKAPRDGLGRIHRVNGAQGFFGHFALAVAGDGSRRPLGLVGVQTWVREGKPMGRKFAGRERQMRDNKESARWTELALATDARANKPVHVMDREAGSYEIFNNLMQNQARFVIRIREANRVVVEGDERNDIADVARKAPLILNRTVPLSRRPKSLLALRNKLHPPRTERSARLAIRARSVTLPRPQNFGKTSELAKTLTLNLVSVREVAAPKHATPVTWAILTTEPIATIADVERIVDAYRARWTIEEFFKALKTGCAYEKRQLESFHSLRNALAIFSVIAWRMLLMRSQSRDAANSPAQTVLTRRQAILLRKLTTLRAPGIPDIQLPPEPNASDALLAVAKLGGHIRNNGPPGWQVIGRGYERLLLLELGWMVARSDQS